MAAYGSSGGAKNIINLKSVHPLSITAGYCSVHSITAPHARPNSQPHGHGHGHELGLSHGYGQGHGHGNGREREREKPSASPDGAVAKRVKLLKTITISTDCTFPSSTSLGERREVVRKALS